MARIFISRNYQVQGHAHAPPGPAEKDMEHRPPAIQAGCCTLARLLPRPCRQQESEISNGNKQGI
ncbi:hypothetical protein COLO4_24656 [Corchorus olitorius]|uniref:Uncharacterized protein n=1 Tax=Corchorus olitorius TaxID=93759 RepID=A0A1R3I8D0_9ROSI|nr:hypothetical protein COLO4_24656 [Corchorus olitorius]